MSGLWMRPFTRRWPIWECEDRVQNAHARLEAPSGELVFPIPSHRPLSISFIDLPAFLIAPPALGYAEAAAGAR